MNVLLLLNGELYKPAVMRERTTAASFDRVIGTDGGARHAADLGVEIDTVIGDMDSISPEERQGMKDVTFVSYLPEKDETDFELALLYARELEPKNIVIIGALGGRMDMTVSNILLAAHAGFGGIRVEVWHGGQTGWVIVPPGEDFTGRPGDTVSLIPLGGRAAGITTRGMKYPLRNEELTFGSARGISNMIAELPAGVEIHEGFLYAVHTRAGAEDMEDRLK